MSGRCSDEEVCVLNVKHENEVRPCLGAAMKQMDDGACEGKILDPFDHSGKVLLLLKDWKKKEDEEVRRVKSLNRHPFWTKSKREEGKLHLNDELTMIKGVGEPTADKFVINNIENVGELANATDEGLRIVANNAD